MFCLWGGIEGGVEGRTGVEGEEGVYITRSSPDNNRLQLFFAYIPHFFPSSSRFFLT